VTAPLVAPTQVAVPLLLIETLMGSETIHVWPEQFTQAGMAQLPETTAAAKNWP